MEELEDGPGPSSSSREDSKGECSEAANDYDDVSITLPEQLQKITPAEEFVGVRHRWNTNEEIASILIAFNRHKEWLMLPQKIRPASGSMLLYNRKVVFYRRDGYCWKKRRNGSTIREDHMKLKVQGLECIYGSYVHSAILPTFHRRCYWLLQNPNIVLLHYLNVPYPEAAKPSILSVFSELKQKEWTKEELVDQLRPMLSQVGQTTEEDTDEEKKVERILEELLPVLMTSKDGNKQLASLSHGLSSQTLTTAHTATLNRLIAPRQSSSQITVYQQQQKTQQQQQQPDNLFQREDQAKSTDTHIQVPLLVKNAIPQSSHKGLNPVQITTHSPYQPILFQVPGDNNSLRTLTSKPLRNESSISDVKPETKNISSHQSIESNINIFSNDSNSLIMQHQNVENPHPLHIQPPVPLDRQLMTPNSTLAKNNVAQLRATNVSHSESDTEMTDSFVNHNSVISKEGALDSLTLKNQYPSSRMASCPSGHLLPSPLSSLMQSDNSITSVAAMDVTVQSQGQMAQQPFQPTELYSKVAHVGIQQQAQQQQLQQNLSQSQQIAQQNHSLVLQSLAQNSHQIHSAPQPICNTSIQSQPQNQQQNQTPLLTLHLKSANSSVDNNSGFVLSLQGATIVAQDSSSMLESQRNQAPSLNISESNGLVLIASQNQSGQLVINRISNNNDSNDVTQNQISTTAAPGAPYIISTSSSQHQTPFKTDTEVSSIFTLNPLTSLQSSSGSHGLSSQNTHVFSPSTMSHCNLLPSPLNRSNSESQQRTAGFTLSATAKEHQQIGSSSSFDKVLFPSGGDSVTQTSSCCSSSMITVCDPTKDLREPVLFGLDTTSTATRAKDFSKMDMSCSHLEAAQTAHQSQQADHTLMIDNTSNIFHSNKENITNPNSCDTLDGSFSSLPTSDLNLDDFLDLHDLQDLTGSPLSPVDISTTSPTTSQYCWESNISSTSTINPSSNSQLGNLGKARGSETSAGALDRKTDLPPFEPSHHDNRHQHQQHYLTCHQVFENQHHVSPTSPNHPGAPPRTYLSFSNTPIPTPNTFPPTSMSTSFPPIPNNQCDSHNNPVADPEINSVIKDFSPDWAYSKTNTKVLVAGPWCRKTSVYTCVFDGDHILAVLLQPGLLRCFTPFHNSGYSTLQVARDGVIISNCEVFEFCDKEKQTVQAIHPEWFDFDKNKLKLLLMERMDQLQRRLTSLSFSIQDTRHDGEAVEHSLVERVESLAGHPWSNTDQYPKAGQHNLTLLHLAAALGWAKFISCLIKWRMENSCVALEFEVDALSVDSHACTPLMWACSLGNIDAALTLYHWNALPLKMCNKDGLVPLSLARQKGHYNLAGQIEQLERSKEEESDKMVSTSHQESSHHKMDITSPPPLLATTAITNTTGPKVGGVKREVKEEGVVTSTPGPPHSFSKPVTPGPKLIRRFSEQAIGQMKGTLNKRNSVDLLPSGQDIDQATLPTLRSSLAASREATSEPQLPVSPDMAFVASPAPRLLLEDKIDEPSCVYASDPSTSRMDTDEVSPVTSASPIIDVERISSDEEIDQGKDGSKHQMVTLANQIIAAIPERIKLSPSKGDDLDDTASSGRGRSESHSSLPSQGSPRPSSFGDDSGISTPVTESLAFEEYRYPEFGTPASSLSPESTCLPSPYSPYSFTLDSPPPTTAEFTEYFNAPTTYMEKDFSQLTLSDQEQRKLYEAAKVIQNAYRHYRDKQMQQQKEIEAAVLIQSYYRRYKTYAYYKKMSHAAVLIQNQFRTYYAKRKKRGDSAGSIQVLRRESERLKKGRNQSVIIQQRFRSHYQRRSFDGKETSMSGQGSGDATNSSPPPAAANCLCPDDPQTINADDHVCGIGEGENDGMTSALDSDSNVGNEPVPHPNSHC